MAKIRRSRHLIDNEVQYNLLKRIVLHWTVFMFANALMYLMWIRLIENPLGTWESTFSLFGKQFAPVLIVSLALLPVFLRDAVKLSNRFAGPILRLRQTLRNLAEGNKSEPLTFRSGDFWQAMSADFNQVVGLKPSTENDTK